MSNFTEDKLEKQREARIELGMTVLAGTMAAWFAPRDPAPEEDHGPAAVDAQLAIDRARKP